MSIQRTAKKIGVLIPGMGAVASTFIAGIEAGDWEKAAVEMMDSRWATQVGARAERLRDRIRALA